MKPSVLDHCNEAMRTHLSTFGHRYDLILFVLFLADSMILLGSVQRTKLQQLLHEHVWDVHIRQTHNSNSSSISSSRQSLDFIVGGAATPPHMPALEEEESDDVIVPAITARMSGFESSTLEHRGQDDDAEKDTPPRPASTLGLSRNTGDFYPHRTLLSHTPSGQDVHNLPHRGSSLPRRFSMSDRIGMGGALANPPRESLRRSSSATNLVPPRLANERLIQSARQSIT